MAEYQHITHAHLCLYFKLCLHPFFFFDKGSCYATQAGLSLVILLPQPHM
jgi:hypothetical protein